ncbi:response regulator [Nitrososphaera sp. AFS]|uniref:response regulator n=1 Tax=Nitrososphaera sp. AFS TaxID=2301191 RepID=UPI0013923873|nr:response regulator [Nitrososphaera sp. AFS]NAL76695.1 response regulator [Nitrososphaera sp. AFS]
MLDNQSERNQPPRIMVVDDERDILRIIKRDLETGDHGITFSVDAFFDSETALDNFCSHPADYYKLVLTDIRMPKMNGFELYRRIKQKNPSMKIAFITAFEITKEEFNKVLPSIDVKHFIKKPVTISNLIPKLRSIIDN